MNQGIARKLCPANQLITSPSYLVSVMRGPTCEQIPRSLASSQQVQFRLHDGIPSQVGTRHSSFGGHLAQTVHDPSIMLAANCIEELAYREFEFLSTSQGTLDATEDVLTPRVMKALDIH